MDRPRGHRRPGGVAVPAAGPLPAGGWRGDPAASFGGIAAHLGVHYLDLACQLLGRPATVALAPVRERAPGIDSRVAAPSSSRAAPPSPSR
ncbi:Gfo/Idh/MocA family oxidoreductase [Actinomadura keratinilytica]